MGTSSLSLFGGRIAVGPLAAGMLQGPRAQHSNGSSSVHDPRKRRVMTTQQTENPSPRPRRMHGATPPALRDGSPARSTGLPPNVFHAYTSLVRPLSAAWSRFCRLRVAAPDAGHRTKFSFPSYHIARIKGPPLSQSLHQRRVQPYRAPVTSSSSTYGCAAGHDDMEQQRTPVWAGLRLSLTSFSRLIRRTGAWD